MATFTSVKIESSYRGTPVQAKGLVSLDSINNTGRTQVYVFESIYMWSDDREQLREPITFNFTDINGNERDLVEVPQLDSYQRQSVLPNVNTFLWNVDGSNKIDYSILPNTRVIMTFKLMPTDHLTEAFARTCQNAGVPKGIEDTMRDVAMIELYDRQYREGIYNIDDAINKAGIDIYGEKKSERIAKDIMVIDTSAEKESEERIDEQIIEDEARGIMEGDEIPQFKPVDAEAKNITKKQAKSSGAKGKEKEVGSEKDYILVTEKRLNIPFIIGLGLVAYFGYKALK